MPCTQHAGSPRARQPSSAGTALAVSNGKVDSWPKLNAKKKNGKSDWERWAELNAICKGKSHYSVEKKAPNGTYRLREQNHEDEIAHCARQWWLSGHWPGDALPLQVLAGGKPVAAPFASVSGDAAIYYGMTLWPLDPSAWRKPDDPVVPTKTDVDNTYWFVEELHRARCPRRRTPDRRPLHPKLVPYAPGGREVYRRLAKPAAAAAVMQDMAQGIDTFAQQPNSGLDLKNKMPSRPTRFAAEG